MNFKRGCPPKISQHLLLRTAVNEKIHVPQAQKAMGRRQTCMSFLCPETVPALLCRPFLVIQVLKPHWSVNPSSDSISKLPFWSSKAFSRMLIFQKAHLKHAVCSPPHHLRGSHWTSGPLPQKEPLLCSLKHTPTSTNINAASTNFWVTALPTS